MMTTKISLGLAVHGLFSRRALTARSVLLNHVAWRAKAPHGALMR
jgi:hypothetical protein